MGFHGLSDGVSPVVTRLLSPPPYFTIATYSTRVCSYSRAQAEVLTLILGFRRLRVGLLPTPKRCLRQLHALSQPTAIALSIIKIIYL